MNSTLEGIFQWTLTMSHQPLSLILTSTCCHICTGKEKWYPELAWSWVLLLDLSMCVYTLQGWPSQRKAYSSVLPAAPHLHHKQMRSQHWQQIRNQPRGRSDVLTGTGEQRLKRVEPKHSVLIGSSQHGHMSVQPKNEHSQGQRACTGIFVNLLTPRTTCRNVSDHVWNVTGYSGNVEKLQMGTVHFTFHIRCNCQLRDNLMQPKLWHRDTLLKPVYS